MKELTIGHIPQFSFDVTESINQLRVNLGFCGSNVKNILITSSVPDEGKSFVTMSLWYQMAAVGAKVLLIDCDLRNSELRSRYQINGVDGMQGVAHYLAGKVELEEVIYQTNVPGGYMIPMISSVTNPPILLEGKRFGQMMEYAKDHFDYVLLDTPPLGSVADALNMATHCDGTVLVVRGGTTSRKLVDSSVEALKRTEIPLLGLVLNRVDSRHNSYYYKQYYKKYGYGYGSKPQRKK